MFLFVGLGNPGEKYEETPHNAGFRAMDILRNAFGHSSVYDVGDWDFDKYTESFLCVGKTELSTKFALAKPNTFMNNSGRAVLNIKKKFEVNIEKDFVLFYDDLDIKLGNYKIVRGKAPKGHKGVQSIFNHLKNQDFLTVRIGIDNREDSKIEGENYVLMKYSKEELEILDKSISQAIKSLRFNLTI